MEILRNSRTTTFGSLFRTVLAAVPLLVALSASPPMAAGVIAPSNCLPPAGSQYAGGVEQWVTVLGLVRLSNPILNQFTTCMTPQPSGTWTESFGSVVSGELFVNGTDNGHVSASAAVSINLTVASNSGGVELLNTQMTQLNANLGGGALIRVDPTTPSTGQTTITDLGGGNFQITSFFDIFTDLSLDNGLTWTPSSGGNGAGGGAVMTLQSGVPEPASFALLGAGLLLFGARKLRK